MNDEQILYVAEIVAWDPKLAATRTLRYASLNGFATSSTDTPASTWYDARLKQPVLIRRDMFSLASSRGESRVGYGNIELINADGALDELVTMGFDGRQVTIWRGAYGRAFPAGFSQVLVGTMMEQPESSGTTLTIKARDRQQELDILLQLNRYAGSNVLPAGLEGIPADLKGKPKPILYGSVQNISAVCVNTSKLIYQVNDGAVLSIDDVRDRGISLKPTMLIGVGTNGKLVTSTDQGANWTAQTSGFGATTINDLVYAASLGLWIAVGGAGKLFTATDPTSTWTSRTSTFGADDIMAIAWNGTTAVIVGGTGKVASSTDGTTWTARTGSFGTGVIRDVEWGAAAGVFVATATATATPLGSSPTGTTWTSRTSNGTTCSAVAWSDHLKLFAVENNSTGEISRDGLTWTAVPMYGAGGAPSACKIRWGPGYFIAGGQTGYYDLSRDGYHWEHFRLSDWSASTDFQALVWTGQRWIAGGQTKPEAISEDGNVWRQVTSTAFGAPETILSYAFVESAVGTYANTTDLLDDTLAPQPGSYKVCLGSGYFRLAGLPAGLITADVTAGATAADRTAAQIFKQILTLAGKTAPDYSATDIATLDVQNASVLGYWSGTDDVKMAAVLDLVLGSIGGWWGVDRFGVFRCAQLNAPNMITNDGFEVDAANTAAFGGATLVRDTTQFLKGIAALKVTTVLNTISGARLDPPTGGARFLVRPGLSYTLAAWVYGTGSAIGKPVRVQVDWYVDTGAGAYLSSSVGTLTPLVAGWQQLLITGSAPGTANGAALYVITDNASLSFIYWVDEVQFSLTPVAYLVANSLRLPPERIRLNDSDAGIPPWRTTVRYAKNWTVQTDVAGAVSADRRTFLAEEYRSAKFEDASIQTAHLLAPEIIEDSLLQVEADALAEATRRQAMRGKQRDPFRLLSALDDEGMVIDLGSIVNLTDRRYALTPGKLFSVLGLLPSAAESSLTSTVWG